MSENAPFPVFTERLTHGKKPVFRHSQTFSLCFLEFSEKVNSRKGTFSNGNHSVNSRKIACISMFTDRSTEGKWLVFQCSPISYRTENSSYSSVFAGVFLVFSCIFWGGEFRKTNVFQRSSHGKHKENITCSGVFLAFSGLAISSEFKKTGAFFRGFVRGVFLVFAFSVGLNIKKKRVFSIFCIPNAIRVLDYFQVP